MKTKILISIVLLSLLALASCDPYNESDANLLIKARVPKCAGIVRVVSDNGTTYYAAVDSAYKMYSFSVSPNGFVEVLSDKK